MSYTFSRRDFMKYTALTAVAIAGSSMLTGCSNPNRPTGTVGSKLSPGSNICDATLKSATYSDNTLTCNFKIYTKLALQINRNHFQVNVTTDGQTKVYYYNNSNIALDCDSLADYKAKTTVSPVLTVKIDELTSADKVEVVYIPKLWAKGSLTDSYSDIYGTWDITKAIRDQLSDDGLV